MFFIGSSVASNLHTDGGPWTLPYFLAAILGIVLMLNGKRMMTVWRAERRGHCHIAEMVHAARVKRRGLKGTITR